jgi:hypothetical protein
MEKIINKDIPNENNIQPNTTETSAKSPII